MVKKTTSRKPQQPLRTKEERTSQRIPIHLLVDYHSNGNYLFDFCRDLGTGGVFIETKSPLPQGSPVELTFTIPDSKETLEAKGKVIWVQPPLDDREELTPGMGIQFFEFSDTQRNVLDDFVKRYRGAKRRPSGADAESA